MKHVGWETKLHNDQHLSPKTIVIIALKLLRAKRIASYLICKRACLKAEEPFASSIKAGYFSP
jgi:hypothetical protein